MITVIENWWNGQDCEWAENLADPIDSDDVASETKSAHIVQWRL